MINIQMHGVIRFEVEADDSGPAKIRNLLIEQEGGQLTTFSLVGLNLGEQVDEMEDWNGPEAA